MVVLQNIADRQIPQKSWGWEEWIVNNNLYCGKRLHFTVEGKGTSLHFHKEKHETMFVECGVFLITLLDFGDTTTRNLRLHPGHSLVIPPLTPHRITCESIDLTRGCEALMYEFSTHHKDSDSYRIAK